MKILKFQEGPAPTFSIPTITMHATTAYCSTVLTLVHAGMLITGQGLRHFGKMLQVNSVLKELYINAGYVRKDTIYFMVLGIYVCVYTYDHA